MNMTMHPRLRAMLTALAGLLMACDPAVEPENSERDDPASARPPTAEDPSAAQACEIYGAERQCDGEGTQFCVGEAGDLQWGECLDYVECMPGETRTCSAPDCDGDEPGCWSETFECELDAQGVPGYWDPGMEDACNTPLVFSFDGGSVEMTASGPATFDISDRGACLTTDWPTANTPWLALDLDRDGAIDSGRELFGSGTRLASGEHASNGFLALAELDSDRDGRISSTDERFSQLVLWSDIDGDRRGHFGEMEPLSMHGILSIELDYTVRRSCDDRGNCEVERASFTFIDRTGEIARGDVVDVHLACQ